MNNSEDDTGSVSSREKNEIRLKIREAFRHARKALQGGRTALRLLRTTQSKSYRASAVHSLGSIWTNRKDLESELRSYAFLQSFDPVVNNLIEDANAHHSNIFGIDGERTTSVLEASSWVGEWGAHLLEAVSELINMQVSFNDAYSEISVHTPEGGLDNLEQTIDHLQLLITRWETVALGSLEGVTSATNDPLQQADDCEELPKLALKALIDGGDPGLISQALKVPAKQRYTATMRKMLDEDRSYYEWTLGEWANHLGASKPTIRGTDAWREIMEYREQSKQDRAGE